jgi:ssRNA-specific RNase YbeY (16S rRNA maturation enzyme)
MKKFYLFLLPLCFALVSCGDEEEKPDDDRKPGINISLPMALDTFAVGQSMPIKVTVVDNDRLKEIHVEILNESDSTEVWMYHLEPGIANVEIDTSHVLNVSAPSVLQIRVEATDFSNNMQEKVQRINVIP